MAAGTIITVLSNVPWGQVIDAAPKVADGATKLWNAVIRRKKDEGGISSDVDITASTPDEKSDPLDQIRVDIESVSSSLGNLRDEMLAATALIKQLADQNTLLIQRVELNRRRLVRLSYAAAIVSTILLTGIIYLFLAK
jgi:hypothetical protein